MSLYFVERTVMESTTLVRRDKGWLARTWYRAVSALGRGFGKTLRRNL